MEDTNKEISITTVSAYCPKCKELNNYKLKNLFKNTENKQVVNPVLMCRFCQNEFWISVSNKKPENKILFGLG